MEYNFSNVLLILHVKYFYNRLRFKVVIDKSCRRATFFRTQCTYIQNGQPSYQFCFLELSVLEIGTGTEQTDLQVATGQTDGQTNWMQCIMQPLRERAA